MASLSDLIRDPDYLSLSPDRQTAIRSDFFRSVIEPDPDFQSLPKDRQAALRLEVIGQTHSGTSFFQSAKQEVGRLLTLPFKTFVEEASAGGEQIQRGLAGESVTVPSFRVPFTDLTTPSATLPAAVRTAGGLARGATAGFLAGTRTLSDPLSRLVQSATGLSEPWRQHVESSADLALGLFGPAAISKFVPKKIPFSQPLPGEGAREFARLSDDMLAQKAEALSQQLALPPAGATAPANVAPRRFVAGPMAGGRIETSTSLETSLLDFPRTPDVVYSVPASPLKTRPQESVEKVLETFGRPLSQGESTGRTLEAADALLTGISRPGLPSESISQIPWTRTRQIGLPYRGLPSGIEGRKRMTQEGYGELPSSPSPSGPFVVMPDTTGGKTLYPSVEVTARELHLPVGQVERVGVRQTLASAADSTTPQGQRTIANVQASLRQSPPLGDSPLANAALTTTMKTPRGVTRIKDVLADAVIPNYQWSDEAVALLRGYRGTQAYETELAFERMRTIARQAKQKGIAREDVGGALKGLSDDPGAQAIAAPWRKEIDENSKQLVKAGILKEETAQANMGEYARRVYLRDILGSDYVPDSESVTAARAFFRENLLFKNRPATTEEIEGVIKNILANQHPTLSLKNRPTLDLSAIKRRQDIPDPIRALMGEVDDGAYLAARTILDQRRMLIAKEYFNAVAKGSETIVQKGATLRVPWVRETPAPGYIKVPDAGSYGAIKGQYLLEKYADDLLPMGAISVPGRIDPFTSMLDKAYFGTLNLFKISKTVLNPAGHIRNFFSNMMMGDFMGIPVWDPRSWPYYKRSAEALLQGVGHPVYAETTKVGSIGAEFANAELKLMARELLAENGNWWKVFQRIAMQPIRAAGNLYNAGDRIFKVAGHLYAKEKLGMTPVEAGAFVNTWNTNYQEVAPLFRALRGTTHTPGGMAAAAVGNPFVSWSAEVARIAMNGAKKHPVKFAKWVLMAPILTEAVMAAQGIQRETMRRAFRRLPEYLQQPNTILWPAKDDQGNLQFFDMTYWHPLGNFMQVNARRNPSLLTGIGKDVGGALGEAAVAQVAPFFGGHPLILAAMGLAKNEDPFTQRPIAHPEEKKAVKGVGFLSRSLLPPLAPGGYAATQIEMAARGLPGRFGLKQTLPQAIGQEVTGIKPIPASSTLALQKIRAINREVAELDERKAAVLKDQRLDLEEKRSRLNRLARLRAEALRGESAIEQLQKQIGLR